MNRISCFRLAGLSLFISFTAAGATVSNCDEASLRSAIASDNVVIFNCDATIVLSNTIVVSTDLTLDATGHTVALNGNNSVRIFDVMPGATLHLINLSLTNGRARGTSGVAGSGQNGGPGQGGAVRMQNAALKALNCRFTSNRAFGGGGASGWAGGRGEGGAIFCASGQVRLTNCVFTTNSAAGGNGGLAPPGSIYFGGPGGEARGGAIFASGSDICFVDCEVVSNEAIPGAGGLGAMGWTGEIYGSWGGGCYLVSGSLAASNCSWLTNSASYGGGGCYNAGSATFDRCRFDRNSAHRGDLAQGGAILSSGALTIRGSRFENNSATGRKGYSRTWDTPFIDGGDAEGGAVCITAGTAGITDSAFVRNETRGGNGELSEGGSATGGALFNQASASILNTSFGFNLAAGGVREPPLDPRIPGTSAGRGGAIAHVGALLTVRFSTIASNDVSDPFSNSTGGGCFSSNSPVQLQSSILSGNNSTRVHDPFTGQSTLTIPNNAAGLFLDLGANLSSDSTPPLSAVGSANNINPGLGGLGNYGGNTLVFALLPNSPALNAAFTPPANDQRGVRRPQGGRADSGAFEQTFLTVRRPSPEQVQVAYDGVPGSVYTLQSSLNLADWIDLETQFADSNGAIVFPNLNASILRFFRVRY